MGLPRQLKNIYYELLKDDYYSHKWVMLGTKYRFTRPFQKPTTNVKYSHLLNCLMRSGCKYDIYEEYGFEKDFSFGNGDEYCDKSNHTIAWFLYFEKQNNQWVKIYKTVKLLSYRLYKLALDKSEKRETKERDVIQKKEELDKIRSIEQGRLFTGRLRAMIMERDNYKCVLCGRDVQDGIKLEVDHIQAWNEGGKTIYDNGQTICSECNKGKFHLEQYKNKVNNLNRAVNNG